MPDDYYFIAFKLHAYTETAPLHSLRTWKWTKYCLLLMLRLESQASSKTFKVINLPFWPELFYLAISLGINTFWIPFIPWNSSFPKMPPIPPTYPHCMQKRTFLHVLVVVAVICHFWQHADLCFAWLPSSSITGASSSSRHGSYVLKLDWRL